MPRPIHDSIILQLHIALSRLGNRKEEGQETESSSSVMCSILEGRTPRYLNEALAPAWKLLGKKALSHPTKFVCRPFSTSIEGSPLQMTTACLSESFQ